MGGIIYLDIDGILGLMAILFGRSGLADSLGGGEPELTRGGSPADEMGERGDEEEGAALGSEGEDTAESSPSGLSWRVSLS